MTSDCSVENVSFTTSAASNAAAAASTGKRRRRSGLIVVGYDVTKSGYTETRHLAIWAE